MTTFSDADVSNLHDASAARGITSSCRASIDLTRIAAEGRRSGSLRAGDRHVGETDRAFDNRGGVAANPDVVAVALCQAPRIGWAGS